MLCKPEWFLLDLLYITLKMSGSSQHDSWTSSTEGLKVNNSELVRMCLSILCLLHMFRLSKPKARVQRGFTQPPESDHKGKSLWVSPLICHLKLSNNNGNNDPSVRKAFTSRSLKSPKRNDVIHHPENFLVTKPEGICQHHLKDWQFWKHNEEVAGRGTYLSSKSWREKWNEPFN